MGDFADVHLVTFFADSDEMIQIVNIFNGYCTSVLALLCHKAGKQTFTVQAPLCAMQCGTIAQLQQCVRILKVCPPCSNGLTDT